MLYNIPYYPIPTGYNNATGLFTFEINQLVNFDFISINNNKIYYHTDTAEFPPPTYFNSTGVLIESINTDVATYGVNLNLNSGIIYIDSLIPGDSGNNINLNSSNSYVFFNDTSLKGGENLYSILKKPKYPLDRKNINLRSPLFSGIFNNKFYITGFYYSFATTGYLNGNINSFVGVRNFENIWSISTGLIVRKDLTSLNFNGNKYIYSGITNTQRIPINVQLSYNNQLSAINNIDIAELVVRDLNAPNSRLSGIIFRITGLA
jgi:hypothetical protein